MRRQCGLECVDTGHSASHLTDHCALLVRSHIACRQIEFECAEGRGCAVRVTVAGRRSSKVLMVSLYLRTGLGPEQQLDILGAVIDAVLEGLTVAGENALSWFDQRRLVADYPLVQASAKLWGAQMASA
eukprot:1203710-Amphidinium_carterae.2